MLPATFCAGMTLPLITRRCCAAGRASGRSERCMPGTRSARSLGVMLGGLVLLPVLGLKWMLIVGAALDMASACCCFAEPVPAPPRSLSGARWPSRHSGRALALIVVIGPRLDSTPAHQRRVSAPETCCSRTTGHASFYRDGRTATVSVTDPPATGRSTLATNGKPDASLAPTWYRALRLHDAAVPLTLRRGHADPAAPRTAGPRAAGQARR